MASILRPFTVIAQVVRAFFRADVRVRRGDRGLELVLDEPAPRRAGASRKPGRTDAAAQREQQELQRMRASLARLLDQRADNRGNLRHLAFVEHALARKGLRGLGKVPYDVLKRALDQFENLVLNWSDEGLATLRSKMAVMLIEREAESPDATTTQRSALPPVEDELDDAPLTHPTPLDGDEAAEAEAALLAAYGDVMLPGLSSGPAGDGGSAPAVELQGELHSPSAKAIAKAARRGEDTHLSRRAHELQA